MRPYPHKSLLTLLIAWLVMGMLVFTGCSSPFDPEETEQKHNIAANPSNETTLPGLSTPRHNNKNAMAEAGQLQKEQDKLLKPAYLTFDDGPNTDFTQKILAILKKEQVKASFIVIGTNVEKNPTILKEIQEEGHAIINHTYSHDYNIIYQSPQQLLADLQKNRSLIQSITGIDTSIFRAPGGPSNLKKAYREALAREGYKSLGWNISSGDSDPAGVTAEQIYANIVSGLDYIETTSLTPIVLMHDGTQLASLDAQEGSANYHYIQSRNSDIEALPKVIQLFKERGYTLLPVDMNTPEAW